MSSPNDQVLFFRRSWWNAAKAFLDSPSERAEFVLAMVEKAFDGETSIKVSPKSSILFEMIGFAANAKVYGSAKAAVGAIGGAAATGEAKSRSKSLIGNQRAKQDGKQNRNQDGKQNRKPKKENKKENIEEERHAPPSISVEQIVGEVSTDGLDGFPAPCTVEQVIAIGASPTCKEQIPEWYCRYFFDQMERVKRWKGQDDRRVRAGSISRILATWYDRDKKNNFRACADFVPGVSVDAPAVLKPSTSVMTSERLNAVE